MVGQTGHICAAPAPGYAALPINASDLHFGTQTQLSAFPGIVFSGDSGCSPSGLRSYFTLEKQVEAFPTRDKCMLCSISLQLQGDRSLFCRSFLWRRLRTLPYVSYKHPTQASILYQTMLFGLIFRSALASLFE